MRRVVPVLLLVGCGGGSAPPPVEKPVEQPVEPRAKRVPIEDSTEEPEDGVTFVHKRGHMDPEKVDASLAPHKPALGECFTTKVGRRRWLGGNVQIRWDVSRDGTVTSVKLVESDLGAWEIEKCLIDVAKLATFDKPVGGDADFMVPLEFTMKGSTQILDEDAAIRAVGKQLDLLDECAKPPRPDAKANGKRSPKAPADDKPAPKWEPPPRDVVITVYVGPQGKPQSVGFSSAKSEIHEVWAECATKAVSAWKLPDPHGVVAKLAIRYRP